MKNTLLLFLTLFILSSAKGQYIKADYMRQVSFADKLRKVLSIEKMKKIDKSTSKAISHYSLTICPKYSYWQFDSIRWDCTTGLRENNRPLDYIQFDTSDVKLIKFHFDPKEQYYLETYKVPHWPMQWDIDFSRTKMILGHRCFWAKPKRKEENTREVWFAPDIPTAFGPEALNGLPGLILEFRTYIARYTAVDISSISPILCPDLPITDIDLIEDKNKRAELWKNYDYSIKGQDFDCGGKAK